LRLRPSGNKGPVATHIDAFQQYQRDNAWIWEHMALTRARTIAGDAALCEESAREVAAILARPREPGVVLEEACRMRDLIAEEKPPANGWDLKLIAGGIIDLEFIAQTAILTGAAAIAGSGETGAVLARLDPDRVPPQMRTELVSAHRL